MNKTYTDFLAELDVYPSYEQIDQASNMAQGKATAYVLSIYPSAAVTVDGGEVYITNSEEVFDEFLLNAQTIFDEEFSRCIEEFQANQPKQVSRIGLK